MYILYCSWKEKAKARTEENMAKMSGEKKDSFGRSLTDVWKQQEERKTLFPRKREEVFDMVEK